MEDFYNRRERLENAFYKWVDEVEEVKGDIVQLIENNNISKSRIAKDVEKMKNKFMTIERNLKKY